MPRCLQQRRQNAQAFVEATGFTLPLLLDSMDNTFQHAFAAHPERFFVVSTQGKLLMKGQPLVSARRAVGLHADHRLLMAFLFRLAQRLMLAPMYGTHRKVATT